jgi:hypothetical protein
MREVCEKFPHSVEKKCQRTAVAGIGDLGRQPPFSKTGINDAGYTLSVDIRFTGRSQPLAVQG